ncbi:hypothetical protein BIU97_12025 [Curtobacterium sp. MCBA15_009]|nr:hypothetical protein BIU97_12025 [Curtobacterium sp. MCBA15_009]
MKDRTEYFESEEGRALTKSIMASLTRSVIRKGFIDPVGKTREQTEWEAGRFFLEHKKDRGSIGLVIDHTDDVLRKAREFRDSGEWDYSIVFYAIFLEHWCNGFILDAEDDEVAARPLLRHKSPVEKLQISWRKAEEAPLPPDLLAVARAVFERRNEFVHYKFPTEPDEGVPDIEGDTNREIAFLASVEDLVSRLHEVEDTYFYQGRAAEFGDRSGQPGPAPSEREPD